jgi:hypothetical protein
MPTPFFSATAPSPLPRPNAIDSAGTRMLRTSEPHTPQAQPAACEPLADTAAEGQRRPKRGGAPAGRKALVDAAQKARAHAA